MEVQEIIIDSSYFLPNNGESEQNQNSQSNKEMTEDDLKREMLNAFKDNIRSKQSSIENMTEEDKKFLFSNSLKFMKAMKDGNIEKASRFLNKLLNEIPEIEEGIKSPEQHSITTKDKNLEVTDTVIKRRKNYF